MESGQSRKLAMTETQTTPMDVKMIAQSMPAGLAIQGQDLPLRLLTIQSHQNATTAATVCGRQEKNATIREQIWTAVQIYAQ